MFGIYEPGRHQQAQAQLGASVYENGDHSAGTIRRIRRRSRCDVHHSLQSLFAKESLGVLGSLHRQSPVSGICSTRSNDTDWGHTVSVGGVGKHELAENHLGRIVVRL